MIAIIAIIAIIVAIIVIISRIASNYRHYCIISRERGFANIVIIAKVACIQNAAYIGRSALFGLWRIHKAPYMPCQRQLPPLF